MLNELWNKCIEGLVGSWNALKLAPALAFSAIGFLIWGLINDWKPQLLLDLIPFDTDEKKAKIIFFVVGWLIALLASTRLMDSITFRLLRWCEGYNWSFSIYYIFGEIDFQCFTKFLLGSQRLTAITIERTIDSIEWDILAKRWIDAEGSLEAEDKSRYVELDEKRLNYPVYYSFMPTILGNILRSAEEYPRLYYGLDIFVVLPRLLLIVPESIKKRIDDAREQLNVCTRLVAWGSLFPIWILMIIPTLQPWQIKIPKLQVLNCLPWQISIILFLDIIIIIWGTRKYYLDCLNELQASLKRIFPDLEIFSPTYVYKEPRRKNSPEAENIPKIAEETLKNYEPNFYLATNYLDRFKKNTRLASWASIIYILVLFFTLDKLIGILMLITFLIVRLAYYEMLVGAKSYGELLRSTFDVYRFDLYESLHWPPPTCPEEEPDEGRKLTKYLFRHRSRHKPEKLPHFLAIEEYHDIKRMEAKLMSEDNSEDHNQPDE